jgi:RHS repeat-associated protein
VSHDKAGNLIDDGTFEYQYDALNRLVKVRSSVDSDVTYQTANFDGLGRRIKKVVANSGDLDGTTVFYYDGQGIIETRDGSGNLVSQFVRGLRYIDEVVMVRAKDEGELYVHQDANWNVVGLTDLGGRLVERYVYRPYGEVIVHQLGGYADYDGDGDVDANDRGEITGLTCGGSNPSGACRVLDLDFDNDCDASDETVFDALPHTGTVIHPARRSSLLGQPFAHQGLYLDPEIGSYQNRARQYHPGHRRFVRRDPVEYTGADGMNLHLAVRANPIRFQDPTGRMARVRDDGDKVSVHLEVATWGNQASLSKVQNAEAWIEYIWNRDPNGLPHYVCHNDDKCKEVEFSAFGLVMPDFDCENDSKGDSPECHAVHDQMTAWFDNSWKVFDQNDPDPNEPIPMWSNGPTGQYPNRGAFANWHVENNCTPGPGCGPWNGNGWAHEAGHLMRGEGHSGVEPEDIMSGCPSCRLWSSTAQVVIILNMNSGGGYTECN